mgnify:CR=1 FL=1
MMRASAALNAGRAAGSATPRRWASCARTALRARCRWTMASADTASAPWSANKAATVVLPALMPPRSPRTKRRPELRRGAGGPNAAPVRPLEAFFIVRLLSRSCRPGSLKPP